MNFYYLDKMIVKIQRALADSEGNLNQILIYDETREFMYQTADPSEVDPIMEILGDKPKAYFNADIVDTKFQILEMVEDQPW